MSRVLAAVFAIQVFMVPSLWANDTPCRPVPGLDELLSPGSVLLLGEAHGSAQAPAFVANAVCLAVAKGLPVEVGLEIHHEETGAVEAYLDSAGADADRQALLATPFWSREYQDGRSSQAMTDLVESLRQYRSAGHAVEVMLFDARRYGARQSRDEGMGKRLLEALEADSKSVHLALMGNVHSRVSQGVPWDSEFQPMGTFVIDGLRKRQVTALNMSCSPGSTVWVCSGGPGTCGEKPWNGRGEGEEWHVTLHEGRAVKGGHHGVYHVGTLTPSRPAIHPEP